MNKLTAALLAAFVAVLLTSGLAVYALPGGAPAPAVNTQQQPVAQAPAPDAGPAAQPAQRGGGSPFSALFGLEESGTASTSQASWAGTARIALRFSLAAVLAALLAFRPRRGVRLSQRNPYVAQTQILLAVVTAAMMMIVGDSAARAFGIFAAASLVRFRTNIRDPKEITILLICLGVGLASGVGRGDVAVLLSLFVLLTLTILEHFESAQVFRSMEMCVATRNVDQTHQVLKQFFARHMFRAELRELNREDGDEPKGKIVYRVSLSQDSDTDRLSEEIMAADPHNIDSFEWDQKKNTTYIYN